MKAAIVVAAGQPPVFGDFRDPTPAPGKSLIRVTASSLSHITRNRASGKHYSADTALPFIPGIDGTGVTQDGQRVYFLLPEAPFGAMAEFCLVDDRHRIALPDSLDEDSAAAMAIPGMSSWAALVERANLRPGETVLINGATGASGRLAIQIAKHLGAGKIIATGRQTALFDDLKRLGADVTLPLVQDHDALEHAFKHEFQQGVDIVLDYLWGISAQTLVVAAAKAGPEGVPIRYVQIGSLSGANINLPGAALRSSALQLMGSGIGSVPFGRLLAAIQGVLAAATAAGFGIAVQSMPLADVAKAWAAEDNGARILLRP
ncbi:quinone oxidoreductase family protein [Acerihabitans arboris]|uniref:Zinc-binding dehydrogenase n=1 Tax=Acerihabitans arboris TaxID=2691583 RepID=A0A845SRT7_9GAMM|nr:zinc-binding alcohol dehydrogenase family protein [Acerihabitans arboris]NDL65358.1 zinc-binding dehydrogenase [Acerihabitans arboris]